MILFPPDEICDDVIKRGRVRDFFFFTHILLGDRLNIKSICQSKVMRLGGGGGTGMTIKNSPWGIELINLNMKCCMFWKNWGTPSKTNFLFCPNQALLLLCLYQIRVSWKKTKIIISQFWNVGHRDKHNKIVSFPMNVFF